MTDSVTAIRYGDPVRGAGRAILSLSDAAATDTGLVGAKAANLAASLKAGLPVLPGFVVTTQGVSDVESREQVRGLGESSALRQQWTQLSADGTRALAVRSSSVAEDTATSSMAGRFVSVLHVRGWDAFADALFDVIDSAAATEIADAPMAVLVQPMAGARVGGVMFGLDPLTGSRSRFLASVAEGLPDQIVSGEVTGTSISLGRCGRVHAMSGPVPALLSAHDRHRLARLARKTARVFGQPQDMEWLIEPDGTLRLLQSRPITASGVPVSHSHPLGPGPVAETFPDPLSPLERDLWEPPLEAGVREALRLSGAVSRRTLAERFVVDVGGRLAVDLEVLGVIQPRRTFWRLLDPRPSYRRLRAAWRIGRLREALPAIVADLGEEVDVRLGELPSVDELGDYELLTILRTSSRTLIGLHAHEVLAGFFLDQRGSGATATTGAAVALATASRARLDGLSDQDIIARHPVTLALLPPRIGAARPLPPVPAAARMPTGVGDDPTALARESMRLRARLMQELSARVALELGRRLAHRGQLHYPEDVRELSLDRLVELVDGIDIAANVLPHKADAPPLPAVFRLALDGSVVADASGGVSRRRGLRRRNQPVSGPQGVSSGRGQGRVTHDPEDSAGAVLVVRSLSPELAGLLPDLAGLVAETGSPLSHLAILAREYAVPAVIGVPNAVSSLADGTVVIVDGTTGSVEEMS